MKRGDLIVEMLKTRLFHFFQIDHAPKNRRLSKPFLTLLCIGSWLKSHGSSKLRLNPGQASRLTQLMIWFQKIRITLHHNRKWSVSSWAELQKAQWVLWGSSCPLQSVSRPNMLPKHHTYTGLAAQRRPDLPDMTRAFEICKCHKESPINRPGRLATWTIPFHDQQSGISGVISTFQMDSSTSRTWWKVEIGKGLRMSSTPATNQAASILKSNSDQPWWYDSQGNNTVQVGSNLFNPNVIDPFAFPEKRVSPITNLKLGSDFKKFARSTQSEGRGQTTPRFFRHSKKPHPT